MEIVSARMGMSVGVAEGRPAVGGTDVKVGGMDGWAETVDVDGISGDLGVDRVCTEKLQPSVTNELNTKIITNNNHLRGFIALSLSTAAHGMESLVGISKLE
jgi:hypothetical protein